MDLSTNLDYYRIFYYVATEGNITKAASSLYISQPAVSMTIKNLEEELGNPLFIRSKRGVSLTKFGSKVYKQVKEALSLLDQIKNIVEDENELLRGEVVIGCGSHIARRILVEPLKNFLEKYPQIKIIQFEEVQSKMFELLRTGKIDLVITQYNGMEDKLVFNGLRCQPYTFVKSPKAKFERFITLTEGSFAQTLFEKFIKDYNLQDIPCLPVSGYNFALELALNGVGTTLVPSYLIDKHVENGELEIVFKDYPLPNINFGYYYNPKLLTHAAKEFLKFL